MSNTDTQIKTANIIGETIISDANGIDVEYGIGGLYPNTMYFRIRTGDEYNYICAGKISESLQNINDRVSSKANSTDLSILKNESDDYDSAINSRLDDIESQLNEKVNQSTYDDFVEKHDCDKYNESISYIESQLNEKVDTSAFGKFKDDVKESLTGDNSIFGSIAVKVESNEDDINKIKEDIKALQIVSDALSDKSAIEAIKLQIELLETELNKKLVASNLTPLREDITKLGERIDTVNSRINTVNGNLDNKASKIYVQTELAPIKSDISKINVELASKINVDQLNKKASKDDVGNLVTNIKRLSNTYDESIKSLEKRCKLVESDIDTKADDIEIKKELNKINTVLTDKADKAELYSEINGVETRVTRLEETCEDLQHDLKCNLSSVKTDIIATDTKFNDLKTTYTNKLNSIDDKIKSLTEKDREITQQLKNEWIRVMTPEEYNRLPKNPYYANGSINPNAVQPNTIYFLVKYNRPYALYIGSTLIAKAEEKGGNIGFTYTFPIVF
jgi:uncharacterized phage infection (PIP) family protein YhgE